MHFFYPDKTTGMIITIARYEWFEQWQANRQKHRGDEYEELKNIFGQKMWEECLERFPQLENKVSSMYFSCSCIAHIDWLCILGVSGIGT